MEGPNELADAIRRMRQADDSDSEDDFDYETLRDGLPLNQYSIQTIGRNDPCLQNVSVFWDDEDDPLLDANGVNWATCESDFGTNEVLKELLIEGFREDPARIPSRMSSNFECFCEALARNRSIEVLAITGCAFDSESTARALKALAPFFQCNSNLRHVEMARCTIDFSNMTQLEHLRCKSNSLEKISVVATKCPPLAKQRMLEALAQQRFLKRIDLTGTKVGWGAMHALTKLLDAPTSNVDTLILRSTSMDDEEISFFVKSITNNGKLRTLCLEGLSLGMVGCRSLSKYLSRSSCAMEALDLSRCQLTDANFILLEMALAKNTSLQYLNLARNDTVTAGAWRVFQLWRYTAIPKSIDLGGNRIPRDFVHEFATSNTPLKSLSLSRTGYMSTTEIRVLSDFLRSSECVLEGLYLSANGVNDVGATMLCSALAINSRLAVLDLCGNPIHNWGIFCGLLCDRSSPSRTHASNHTLESLGPLAHYDTRPSRLKDLLQMNEDSDKTAVARSKILRTHLLRENPDGDNIQLLCNMEVELLPRVLAWLGYVRDDDGFALTYQLLARLPELFFCQNPGMKKRKRA